MYDYELIRSRRRSIAIEIDRTGSIRVRAPYNVGNMKIRQFVEDKSAWIDKTLKKIEERKYPSVAYELAEEILKKSGTFRHFRKHPLYIFFSRKCT